MILPTHRYWLIWFVSFFLLFIIPEVAALVSGHPERTLSAAIWSLEGYTPKGWGWNAFRFLFLGAFSWLCIWLIGHFSFRLWT